MDYKLVKFKNNNKEIDIKIDKENKTAWFTSEDMRELFGRDKSTISRQISDALNNVNQKDQFVARLATFRFFKGKLIERKVKHYSFEIVNKIAQKLDPELRIELAKFIENYLKDNEPLLLTDDDIIIYDNGSLKIPVSISENKQTVYLSQADIAILFGTTRENINLHINNIIQEGELDINSVSKYYLHTASDGKKYNVNKYNLDMILAVGYRTRTKAAIQFRHWASDILKNYMFDGYSINAERCIECKDAVVSLANCVYSLKTNVDKLVTNRYKELAYEPGDQLRGFIEVKRYLESAEKEILIIDNYFGHEFDEILEKLKVKKTVITNPHNEKIETTQNYQVIKTEYFHDRFIFVDDICYHFGTSPKDLGLHYSIAIRMQDFTIKDAYKKLEKNELERSTHN